MDTYVKARIGKSLKQRAEQTLKSMGITTSDYIRMALIRLADEKAIPFKMKSLNKTTIKALDDVEKNKVQSYSDLNSLYKELNIK